jgi:hypothetical protein
MEQDIFEYDTWNVADNFVFVFEQVKFLRDFGPFVAGEEFEGIVLDYGQGILEVRDSDGALIKSTRLALVAVDP